MMHLLPSIVGLSIHDHAVTAAAIKKRGRETELMAFSHVDLKPGIVEEGVIKQPSALTTAIVQALQKANPNPITEKKAVVTIPETKVFLQTFALPKNMKPREMRTALPYEVAGTIPVPLEELEWDTLQLAPTPKTPAGKQDLLFVGVPKTIIAKYMEVVEQANIAVEAITIDAQNILNVMEKTVAETAVFLNINPTSGTLSIVDRGGIRQTNNLSHVVRAARTPAEQMEKIMELGQKTVEANATNGSPTLYAFGESFQESDHIEALRAKAKWPMELIDIQKFLRVDPARFLPKQEKKISKIKTALYLTAIAAGVSALQKKTTLNLLPTHRKTATVEKRIQWLVNVAAVALIVFASTLLVSFSTSFGSLFFELNKTIAESNSLQLMLGSKEFQDVREKIRIFNSEVELLHRIQQTIQPQADLFAALAETPRDGITIRSISFNKKNQEVMLRGRALNREKLLNFQANLKKIPWIQTIRSPLSNFDEPRNLSFRLEISITSPPLS